MKTGEVDFIMAAEAASGTQLKSRQLPSMPITFVGGRDTYEDRTYSLAELTQRPIYSFQRRSQPHGKLMKLLQNRDIDTSCVHPISSIWAMVELVANGPGIATLPFTSIDRLGADSRLRQVHCSDVPTLTDLPVFGSWRRNPEAPQVDKIIDHALNFIDSRTSPKARPRP